VALKLVEEGAILVHQMCPRRADIELHAETWPVPHVDEPIRDNGVRQPVDDVVPPSGLADRVLEGDVVARQGGTDLDERGEPEEAIGSPVRRHQEAVQVRVFGHPFQLGQTADIAWIGTDNVDGMTFDQL